MAYATQTDVVNAIGAKTLILIADDDRDGTADAVVVTKSLDEASSFADSYFPSELPLSTVPDMLRRAVVSIAVELMRLPRDKSTDDSKRAYDIAVKWLTDISKGTASLFPTPSDGVVDPGDPELVSEDRMWTRATGTVF
jgi:phage gp36-like protein